MIRKWLAVGIILLFVAIAIIPAVAEDTKQVIPASRGFVKIHFYEDLDNDSVFDTNEPSPPFLFIHLKNQYPSHSLIINRFKIIGGSGNVLFRFIPYPAVYNLTADYARNLYGCMTELWIYSDIINLNEDMVGTQIYLPIHHFIMPI